jgi:dual specificity protein kinase YAK1
MLSLLNQERSNHILKYYESFTHKQHLCLVTELLSVNLYELLKQNHFRCAPPCRQI